MNFKNFLKFVKFVFSIYGLERVREIGNGGNFSAFGDCKARLYVYSILRPFYVSHFFHLFDYALRKLRDSRANFINTVITCMAY